MHLLIILLIIVVAWMTRSAVGLGQGSWSDRWRQALFLLLFPALLISTMAIAILYMGCHGAMLGVKAGSLGCGVAASLLVFALGCLCWRAYQGGDSIEQLDNCALDFIAGATARVIDTELLYSAQIGFWQPQLVVSSGLLKVLDREHLAAVLAHEQAHLYYRDTFWFFWLGWIRSFTAWLPRTEIIWQELLLLRELRADGKAAESVDYLLLAESLLTVAKNPLDSPLVGANLHESGVGDRLNERIDALLDPPKASESATWQQWSWVGLVFLPLLTIPFHY